MKIDITVLNENTAGGTCQAEWGLSILVRTPEAGVLLDTGMSGAAAHNAGVLGEDLSNLDRIVLSHAHSDHTGGLRDVLLKINHEIEITAHPDVWQLKYDRRKDRPAMFLGIPYRREALESLGAIFKLERGPVRISEHIRTTGEIPMVTEYESIDPILFVRENGELLPDPVMDDRALVIDSGKGLVIILGCAHRGMINTIYHAQQITGIKEINTVIGGSHLISASEERLWQTIAALKELGVRKLGLCHCTDLPVISTLAAEFGQDFIFIKAGTRVTVE